MRRLVGTLCLVVGWFLLICCVVVAPNSLLADSGPDPQPSDYCTPIDCDKSPPDNCADHVPTELEPCKKKSSKCVDLTKTECPERCVCRQVSSDCECWDPLSKTEV